jgi:hypothetical protein
MDPRRLSALNKYNKPVNAMDLPTNVRLMLHGDHGAWKTVTACRIAGLSGRVLLYTTDEDWKSLKNHPEIMSNVDVMTHQEPAQLRFLVEALADGVEGYDQYKGFVLDSANGWVLDLLDNLMENTQISESKGRTKILPRAGKPAAAKLIADLDLLLAEQSDFNTIRNKMAKLLRYLNRFDGHVIINSHTRYASSNNDKLAKVDTLRPDLPEQTFHTIARKMDAIGYMQADDRGATIDFKKSHTLATKSRMDVLNGQKLSVDSAIKRIASWIER